jgi:hypothetical protein
VVRAAKKALHHHCVYAQVTWKHPFILACTASWAVAVPIDVISGRLAGRLNGTPNLCDCRVRHAERVFS